MTQEKARTYAEQTEQKTNQMLERVKGLSEEDLHRKPSPEAWSVMEILCHVAEALEYWRQELVRVVQNRGGDWGRGLQDERRLAAVARADERNLKEVAEELRSAANACREMLLKLNDEDLAIEAPHRNPKFGTKPMSFLVDHFIIDHLDAHIRQIDRNIG